jgi:hypothetical protein
MRFASIIIVVFFFCCWNVVSQYSSCGEDRFCVPNEKCDDSSIILWIYCGEESICCDNSNIIKEIITPDYKCGIKNTKSGKEGELGEFPWIVGIVDKRKFGNPVFIGSGSIIRPDIVLTAAHKVTNLTTDSSFVWAGISNLQFIDNEDLYSLEEAKIRKVVIHERFHAKRLYNDIALIFLEKPLRLKDNVGVLCLPPKDFNFDETQCVAMGWEKDEAGGIKSELERVDLPVVGREQCESMLYEARGWRKKFIFHYNFICAGGEKGKGNENLISLGKIQTKI